MQTSYDLHTHSTASDGTLAPAALVRAAVESGVTVLALTDHDTLEGLVEAGEEARALGISLIPGVEISVSWNNRTIHMLGLSVDLEATDLQLGLAGLREFRDSRAVKIGERLEKYGISGAYEGALALSNGRLVSRTHFARYLVQQGHVADVRKVFKKFLVPGKPGHVKGEWADLQSAIGWVKQAGGIAVIAHPARYGMTRTVLRRLLADFKEAGGEGLEVVSGSHSYDEALTMGRYANEFKLMASSGSDFHSPENAWSRLGHLPELPMGCRPVWDFWQQH